MPARKATTQQNVPPPPFPATLARSSRCTTPDFRRLRPRRFRLDDHGHRVAARERVGISGSQNIGAELDLPTAPVTRRQRHAHHRSNHPSRSASETTRPPGTRLIAPFLSHCCPLSVTSHPLLFFFPFFFSRQPDWERKKPGHARRQFPTNSIDFSADTARTQTLGTKPHHRNAHLHPHSWFLHRTAGLVLDFPRSRQNSLAPGSAVAPSLTSPLPSD